MSHVYRISKSSDIGALVDSIEAIKAFARHHGPGRYEVDEHSVNPFPGTNVSARAWGTIIHQPDGHVALKPYFFGDHYAVVLPDTSKMRGPRRNGDLRP
jgi:hypothetical protein